MVVFLRSQPCGPADITGSWCPDLEEGPESQGQVQEGLEVIGLNGCPPSKFICGSCNTQCDGMWKWGLWEVIGCR